MKQRRSFTEYVADRFYNEMLAAINPFVIKNRQNLDLYSCTVMDIKYAELQNITVQSISVDNRPDQKIAFDVIVDSEIEVKDYNRHNDYNDEINQWFLLSCSGDLGCLLKDFTIHSVEIYDRRKYHENPISDALVPYIHHDDLVKYAIEFFKAHYPEALKEPMFLYPMKLAERMGLTVKLTRIQPDLTIWEASFFKECDT